jgi:hypothetical protein
MRNQLAVIVVGILLGGGQILVGQSKTFIFHNSIRNLDEFRGYVEIASRLKRYGRVQVDLGVLAEKNPVHIPGVRSPWHDYGAYMATAWAFFPHPRIAPHIPAEWVNKNRALLLAKVEILEEFHLEAVFSANETQFMPESFFREYPDLRGPRVDKPTRSGKDEFAWCVDQPDTLEMIEWMMAALKENAPQIQEVHSWNNDSGSGICWLQALYPGPNGPAHCRDRDPGQRVAGLIEAVDRGARKGGGPISVRLAGNFRGKDREKIEPLLPSCAKFRQGDDSIIVVQTRATEAYPVRGLIDLFVVLDALSRLDDPEVRTVDINTCQSWYFRTDEPLATVSRVVDIVEDCIKAPVSDLTSKARSLARTWAGGAEADPVVEAFRLMEQSFSIFARGYFREVVCSPGYAYTATNRLMTRPLLIKPELLSPEEEAYFLPFIFSTDEDDARLDYKTAHGDRRHRVSEYRSPGFRKIHDTALEAAGIFEKMAGTAEGLWFKQLALSLRLWASTVRSHDNFYFGQEIRDRNVENLAAPPRYLPTNTDTPDLLFWNEIQRDELDNAVDLIRMLENGGLKLVAWAREPLVEDIFLYGPDLLNDIQKKVDLMREHWLDGQRYLTPPRENPWR